MAIFACNNVAGQDSISHRKMADVSLNFGGGAFSNSHYSFKELKSFFPESEILKEMSGSGESYPLNDMNGFSGAQLTFGVFSPGRGIISSKHLTGWRFGISYMSLNLLDYYSYSEKSFRLDTLFNQNGDVVSVRDSVFSYNRTLKFRSGLMSIESSYLIRFNGDKRWSYYLGLGGYCGMTLQNEMLLDESVYSGIKTINVQNGNEYTVSWKEENGNKTELKQVSPGFAAGGFIPFGLDFKFTRKPRGFDFLHLFIEGRTGMNFIQTSGLRTSIGTTVFMSFGFRTIL